MPSALSMGRQASLAMDSAVGGCERPSLVLLGRSRHVSLLLRVLSSMAGSCEDKPSDAQQHGSTTVKGNPAVCKGSKANP